MANFSTALDVTSDYQKDKQEQAAFHYVGDLDSTAGYVPPPFGEEQEIEDLAESSPSGVRQIIPTPPPESKHDSPAPDSTHSSHGSCVSPQFSASATSNSYIKGSSLEESPVSSPGSSYAGEHNTNGQASFIASNMVAEMPKLIKRETCIRSTSDDTASSMPGGAANTSREQNVPKNIKLPQRKGGMQLWQFLYALLNDPDKKYRKLIEWTANSLSREFRLLEPEAIAIWWGEHKNKKNMSYDKLSRSLRYYYDKGIIRKISGERYVYQFCINPELMYKHIGNSESRPKLKPMPSSAYHATSEYQNEHGFAAAALLNKDPCFVAQGPMSLGLHGHFRSAYPPPPSYSSPFLSHGYPDFNMDLHNSAYNNVFFPSTGYDAISAVPHMSASIGYASMEPPVPLKAHLPPLRRSHSYDMPSLTPVTQLNDNSYGKPTTNSSLNPVQHLKFETEYCGKSPMLHSSSSPQHGTLSSHTLSPPPLTTNRVASPITPSFPNQESPLSHSAYSNHSSPHTYSGSNTEHLGFDDLMPFSSADEYSTNTLTYPSAYSKSNSTHSHVTSTVAINSWE